MAIAVVVVVVVVVFVVVVVVVVLVVLVIVALVSSSRSSSSSSRSCSNNIALGSLSFLAACGSYTSNLVGRLIKCGEKGEYLAVGGTPSPQKLHY